MAITRPSPGGHTYLNRIGKTLENVVPGAKTAAMTFINNDQIKSIGFQCFKDAQTAGVGGIKRLVNAEVDLMVAGNFASFDQGQWITATFVKWFKGVIALIAQHNQVGEKKDTLVGIITRFDQFPDQLHGNKGFARARR